MKIDLRKLNGAYGSKIDFEFKIDLSKEELFGQCFFKTPVECSGKIVNHLGVLKLDGSACAVLSTQCSRCLKHLEIPIEVFVNAVLSRDNSESDDVFKIVNDSVDLKDIFVPELLLNIEMIYLCKEDCKGLCSVCGSNRNFTTCDCEDKQIDPRLAALAALLDDKQG